MPERLQSKGTDDKSNLDYYKVVELQENGKPCYWLIQNEAAFDEELRREREAARTHFPSCGLMKRMAEKYGKRITRREFVKGEVFISVSNSVGYAQYTMRLKERKK